jgi:hypothetical protein
MHGGSCSTEMGCAHVRGSTRKTASLQVDNCAGHLHSSVDADHPKKKYRRRRRRYSPAEWGIGPGGLLICAFSVAMIALWGIVKLRQTSGDGDSSSVPKPVRVKMTKRLKALLPSSLHQEQHLEDDFHATIVPENPSSSRRSLQLAHQFDVNRRDPETSGYKVREMLTEWLKEVDSEIRNNVRGGMRWLQPNLLPPLSKEGWHAPEKRDRDPEPDQAFFKVQRMDDTPMAWEAEWEALLAAGKTDPPVDYTVRSKYNYPNLQMEPPDQGGYPKLKTMKEIMDIWPQDEDLTGTFTETLLHFNFSDPVEREAALQFRDAELPFKVYDVPEVLLATEKWTDEYLALHFRDKRLKRHNLFQQRKTNTPQAQGTVQESASNFFAFFFKQKWDVEVYGLPPSRDNDWSFTKWSEHARYADAAPLAPDQPHFYFQAGVTPEERYKEESQWCFISRDLPSWSSPTETFFVFNPESQKGIQCRFGERGVVAATHYDTGRNMIAMVTGAKRYILSPPRECSNLGLFTQQKSPIRRHSVLNFGHISRLNDPESGMSDKERAWLERASRSQAIDTVLKKGEVLYIPSHWFHYIVSIQKSGQCNVRSGVDAEGTAEFGNQTDVRECKARAE